MFKNLDLLCKRFNSIQMLEVIDSSKNLLNISINLKLVQYTITFITFWVLYLPKSSQKCIGWVRKFEMHFHRFETAKLNFLPCILSYSIFEFYFIIKLQCCRNIISCFFFLNASSIFCHILNRDYPSILSKIIFYYKKTFWPIWHYMFRQC